MYSSVVKRSFRHTRGHIGHERNYCLFLAFIKEGILHNIWNDPARLISLLILNLLRLLGYLNTPNLSWLFGHSNRLESTRATYMGTLFHLWIRFRLTPFYALFCPSTLSCHYDTLTRWNTTVTKHVHNNTFCGITANAGNNLLIDYQVQPKIVVILHRT